MSSVKKERESKIQASSSGAIKPSSSTVSNNNNNIINNVRSNSTLLEAAEKVSSEILSRYQENANTSGMSVTHLDLKSLGLEDHSDGRRNINTMQCDYLNQLKRVLGNKTVMVAPCLQDIHIEGTENMSRGVAESPGVVEEWISHIDDMLLHSYDTGLDIEDFDVSTLLLRKSTLLCTLGKYNEAEKCALSALDFIVTPLGLFRLACAQYMLSNYTEALESILQANALDGHNRHIENALLVILFRLRSRKDRPDAIIIDP